MKIKIIKPCLTLVIALTFILSSAFIGVSTVEKIDASDEQNVLNNIGVTIPNSIVEEIDIFHVEKNINTEPLPVINGWTSISFNGPDLWHYTTNDYSSPPEALFCADDNTNHYPAGIDNQIVLNFAHFGINPTCYVPTGIFDITGQMNFRIHPDDTIFPIILVDTTWVSLGQSRLTADDTGGWISFSFEALLSPFGSNLLDALENVANIAGGYGLSDVNGVGFSLTDDARSSGTIGLSTGSFSGMLIDQVSVTFSYELVGFGIFVGFSSTPSTQNCPARTFDFDFPPGFICLIDSGNWACSFIHTSPQFSGSEGTYSPSFTGPCFTFGPFRIFLRLSGAGGVITINSHIARP